MTDQRVLSVKQVSERLGQSQKTIRRYIQRGMLEAYKLGGNDRSNRPFRILEKDFDAFLGISSNKKEGKTK